MSQPHRSARLAVRFQSTRSSPPSQPPQPMAIDLTDTEPISDGLSDDPVFSEVDMLPAPSCFVCDGTSLLLGLSLVASCNVAPFPSLTVCDRSGASAFSMCGLPRPVPFLLGLLPLPALVLCLSSGGSCKRVHDLFFPSNLRFFLIFSLRSPQNRWDEEEKGNQKHDMCEAGEQDERHQPEAGEQKGGAEDTCDCDSESHSVPWSRAGVQEKYNHDESAGRGREVEA